MIAWPNSHSVITFISLLLTVPGCSPVTCPSLSLAGKDADYAGKGVDQLADVIHTIKTNPNSRRIILTAWNPTGARTPVLGASGRAGLYERMMLLSVYHVITLNLQSLQC